jgi:hypothetical protein
MRVNLSVPDVTANSSVVYRARPRIGSRASGGIRLAHFHKDPALIYSLVIGCVGAALFLLVDKYEKDEMVAKRLKLMVLVIPSVAILHRLQPFGIQLF